MFCWSKCGFLNMMSLFVGAVSLIVNALNSRKCKISYSHYILSSSINSTYFKSSFKFTFTLVWAIRLGHILRCKDVLNWLVLSQCSSRWVQSQTTLPLKRSFFPRCDWCKIADQAHVHQSKTITKLGTTFSIFRKETRCTLIWIEETRQMNTGQGSRDICSTSALITLTSKGWWSTQRISESGWKKPLRSSSPTYDWTSPHHPDSGTATSSLFLNTTRDGDSTTSWGSLF